MHQTDRSLSRTLLCIVCITYTVGIKVNMHRYIWSISVTARCSFSIILPLLLLLLLPATATRTSRRRLQGRCLRFTSHSAIRLDSVVSPDSSCDCTSRRICNWIRWRFRRESFSKIVDTFSFGRAGLSSHQNLVRHCRLDKRSKVPSCKTRLKTLVGCDKANQVPIIKSSRCSSSKKRIRPSYRKRPCSVEDSIQARHQSPSPQSKTRQ